MRRAVVRLLPAAVLLVTGAVAGPAQERPVPQPYDPAEFAPELRHLRRGEIVAVGAFPFALLLSTIVYDYARWAGDGFSEATTPFGRALDQDPFDDDEKVGIVLAAAGVAVVVAVADYLIGQAAEPPRYTDSATSAARGMQGSVPLPPATAASSAALLSASLATLWPRAALSRAANSGAGGAAAHG